jgi:hypothetical protein
MSTLITAVTAALTLASGVAAPAYTAAESGRVVKARYPSYAYDDYDARYRNGHGYNGYYDNRIGAWCYAGERRFECRERVAYERRYNRRYEWRDGRYYYYRDSRYRSDHDDDVGAAIAGSILGFALGAAIVGNRDDYDYYNRHRYDRTWQSECRRRYSNFDPYTGTYLERDGYRRYCRY